MKLADSVSGHLKTRNQVLVHQIQPTLPWQQHPKIWAIKEAKNTRKMTFLPLNYSKNRLFQSLTWNYFDKKT